MQQKFVIKGHLKDFTMVSVNVDDNIKSMFKFTLESVLAYYYVDGKHFEKKCKKEIPILVREDAFEHFLSSSYTIIAMFKHVYIRSQDRMQYITILVAL